MTYPDIDPTLVYIGLLQVQWYGLMYLGFLAAYFLIRLQGKTRPIDLGLERM